MTVFSPQAPTPRKPLSQPEKESEKESEREPETQPKMSLALKSEESQKRKSAQQPKQKHKHHRRRPWYFPRREHGLLAAILGLITAIVSNLQTAINVIHWLLGILSHVSAGK